MDKMFRYLRSERGMTLVELMVVVAIIAIIAAIAITLYQDVQKKAKLAADAGTIAALRSAVAIYYGKHNGNFPSSGDLNSLVVPSPTFQCTGNTYSLFAGNGKISFSTNDIDDC
jgi:prepilin-type N-terminal cleavage/methylation domain-containing protein